jgi:hypothetical protein
MRFNQYLQLINSTLLAMAVFSAAYVGRLIQQRADLAQRALTEIQDRLADQTGIASLRMFASAAASSAARLRTRHIADVAMIGAAVAWLAAAVYPISWAAGS